jgi:GNAT superfamily N-acetyltransferase
MKQNWLITEISFTDIDFIWREHLWPMRTSAYETHSAMTWPYTSEQVYDMSIFDYEAIYWGCYDSDRLVGVNSGHATSESEYRSRGLWVDPDYRSQGMGITLLTKTVMYAESQGYEMVWSLPRVSALPTYHTVGFQDQGPVISTETSDQNQYVRLYF